MADVFCEQLVKKEPTGRDAVNRALIIIAAILAALVIFLIYWPLFVMAVAVEIFLVKFIFSFINVEYEYIFTSGELDIDVVYAKSRRKRKHTIDLRACEYVRRLREGERAPQAEKVYDYTGRGADKSGVYAISANIKNVRSIILFEPKEAMVEAIRKAITRKLQN